MDTTLEYKKFMDFALTLGVILISLIAFHFAFPQLRSEHSFYGVLYRYISPLFANHNSELTFKFFALVITASYNLGLTHKKKTELNIIAQIVLPLIVGLFFLYGTSVMAHLFNRFYSIVYTLTLFIGYGLLFYCTANIFKIYQGRKKIGQFDRENKHFPMLNEEIKTSDSVNIKARNSWINIINHYSAVLVTGSPNSGKSYVFMYEALIQLMQKGFTIALFDYKGGLMTKIAYNIFVKHYHSIKCLIPGVKFHVFDPFNPLKSVRLNPFNNLDSIDACIDAATVFYYNLNIEAVKKKGEFFTESGRIYICMLLVFLRFNSLKSKKNKEGVAITGNCCTLAHLIALSTIASDSLYEIFDVQEETKAMFSTFKDAWKSGASKQLSGQLASGKIPLSLLDSPQIMWALSGEDVSLEINDPNNPSILCLVNTYGKDERLCPILGLIINQICTSINKPGKLPCHLNIDEASTIYFQDLGKLIATGRSNKISTWLCLQDFQMFVKAYGKDAAEVIINTVSTLITGRVKRDTAKDFQEMFGKTMHDRVSKTITKQGTQQSFSQQLEYLLPAAEIGQFSSGEFAGILADTYENPLPIKIFRDFPVIDRNVRKEYEKDVILPDQIALPENCNLDSVLINNKKKIYREVKELIQQVHANLFAVQ